MAGRILLRRSFVVICVALVLVYSVQRILIAAETLKHDFQIAHDASPLAGTVAGCRMSEESCQDKEDSHFPVFHMHTAIDAGANLIVDWRDVLPLFRLSVAQFNPADQGTHHGKGQLAPERPPKG